MPSVSSRRNTMSTSLCTDGMAACDRDGRTAANRSNFLRTGGMTDRSHHPAVEPAQRLLCHRGKRVAVLLVATFSDRQFLPVDGEALACGRGLHHLDAFRNDFEADIVAEQDSDTQCHSSTVIPMSSTSRFQLAISSRSQPLGSSSQFRCGTTMPQRANASCSSGTVIA